MNFDELLQELEVDIATVMSRFCNNKMLLQRFILKFPTEKTFGELQLAYQEQRFEDAKLAVHTLKGISANLSFLKLFDRCVIMLDDLRGAQEKLSANFTDILTEYHRIIDCINKFILSNSSKE